MRPSTYHLPQGRNVQFIDPQLSALPGVVAENKRRLASAAFIVGGVPHREAAALARAQALELAVAYTRSLGVEVDSPPAVGTIIAAGHQPGINHPGVWIKHHLVDHLARQLGGCGVHIILDTDTPGSLDFQIPCLGNGPAHVKHLRCIPVQTGVAVEEQQLDDPRCIDELIEQSLPLLQLETSHPPASAYLANLRAAAEESTSLSYVLARARRTVEAAWGIANLELPYSATCGLDSFRLLALEIIRRADDFARIYNARLADYRKAYKVRGKANPLHDLALDGDRIELPLWMWRAGGERRSLVVRRNGSATELLFGREVVQTLSQHQLTNPSDGLEALRQLDAAGIRMRSKALVTTIYMRLFLFDLFIHGIGGGNYDIITNEIVRDFFGFDPPTYGVATASASMPFEQKNVSRQDLIKMREQAGRMHHSSHNLAGNLLPHDPETVALLAQRKETLHKQERAVDKAEKKRLFKCTRVIDAQLREKLRPFIADKEKEIGEVREALDYNAIAAGREYPFCIYPEELLRKVYSFGPES
ncbi:MAG: hypothetical protein HQ592_05590 [Planctomycetes bacterium]|nr:hypothetical protein [Planctomycetota bacterium]